MDSGVMVVLTRAFEGRREELWDWYSTRHIVDLLDVPGFKRARLWSLGALGAGGEAAHHCMALYDLEAEDLTTVLQEAGRRMGGEQMPKSPALDSSKTVTFLARTPVEMTAAEAAAQRAAAKS